SYLIPFWSRPNCCLKVSKDLANAGKRNVLERQRRKMAGKMPVSDYFCEKFLSSQKKMLEILHLEWSLYGQKIPLGKKKPNKEVKFFASIDDFLTVLAHS